MTRFCLLLSARCFVAVRAVCAARWRAATCDVCSLDILLQCIASPFIPVPYPVLQSFTFAGTPEVLVKYNKLDLSGNKVTVQHASCMLAS
jgi:hypothetical protein